MREAQNKPTMRNGQAFEQTKSLLDRSMSLEVLDCSFVFLGRCSRLKCAKVPALAGFRILLPGVESILP